MLEFLSFIEKKLPHGFTLEFQIGVTGIVVIFCYGKVFHRTSVPFSHLDPLMKNETKDQYSEIIFDDIVKKMRAHPSFPKQKHNRVGV